MLEVCFSTWQPVCTQCVNDFFCLKRFIHSTSVYVCVCLYVCVHMCTCVCVWRCKLLCCEYKQYELLFLQVVGM